MNKIVLGQGNRLVASRECSPGCASLHPAPTDEDLSVGTPARHPTDEDLSVGTPARGYYHPLTPVVAKTGDGTPYTCSSIERSRTYGSPYSTKIGFKTREKGYASK
jgi:hypothetical protein